MEILNALAYKNFNNTLKNWIKDCPDEIAGICEEELNAEDLVFKDLTKSDDGTLLSAEYTIIFSNGVKAVYILKFKNNVLFDDVFYIER